MPGHHILYPGSSCIVNQHHPGRGPSCVGGGARGSSPVLSGLCPFRCAVVWTSLETMSVPIQGCCWASPMPMASTNTGFLGSQVCYAEHTFLSQASPFAQMQHAVVFCEGALFRHPASGWE